MAYTRCSDSVLQNFQEQLYGYTPVLHSMRQQVPSELSATVM
jgi:hypothetical protein